MIARIDYRPPSAKRRPSWFPTYLFLVVAILGLSFLLIPGVFFLSAILSLGGSSSSIAPPKVAQSVAGMLMEWNAFDPTHHFDPEYSQQKNSVLSRTIGINGYTESDGFHGDGDDWYEAKLSPDLAAELKLNSAKFKLKKQNFPPGGDSAPSWWPKAWPADAQFYGMEFIGIAVTEGGTRIWIHGIRS